MDLTLFVNRYLHLHCLLAQTIPRKHLSTILSGGQSNFVTPLGNSLLFNKYPGSNDFVAFEKIVTRYFNGSGKPKLGCGFHVTCYIPCTKKALLHYWYFFLITA